jgi:hypothetical protein
MAAPPGGLFVSAVLMQSGDTFSAKQPQYLITTDQSIAGRGERRHKLGKIEASRHKWRNNFGTRARHSIGPDRTEGKKAVASRFSGALLRAFLVVLVVVTPSLLLSGVSNDAKQMAALVALFAGLLTFVEYNAEAPSLIEFRDAPPFNRVRLGMLFATILALSIMESGRDSPTSLTEFVRAIGHLIGKSMDFPYSPVRLATLMLSDGASPAQLQAVRDAAGVAYLASLVSLSVFVVLLRLGAWPTRGRAFNVWVNLPTFDPASGPDVVGRLDRDARLNIALGFLLPFIIPFVISLSSSGINPLSLTASQTLIWTMTAWSFLPASLFMRGIAMGRIAEMIREMRRLRGEADASELSRASRVF